MNTLPKSFSSERKTVCVQGLGFVGSAMALAIANAKSADGTPLYNVIGVNRSSKSGEEKAALINSGIFPFENNDEKLKSAFAGVHEAGNLWATTDSEYFAYADVALIDINLDVKYAENGEPYLDLTDFRLAVHTLGSRIKPDALVIVETTVPPGTCENVVYPILKEELERRSLPVDKISVAHSYERVMPGKDYFDSIINFWRVFSGIDERSADRCESFLKTVIRTDKYPLTRLKKTASTETAKVLENSYRAMTIAFMEEWGRFAEDIGVDLFEVIDAIRMRPTHSNMRQPGFGVGGYCLTKDPYFAMLASKDIFGLEGHDFPFSTGAVRVNNAMPLVSLDKIQRLLDGSLENKKLLVLGVSYRQDVGDTRHSPTETFAKEAIKRGAVLTFEDPLVKYWKELDTDVLQTVPAFTGYDAVVFTVPHSQYQNIDFTSVVVDDETLVFDTNCVLSAEQREDINNRRDIRFAAIGR